MTKEPRITVDSEIFLGRLGEQDLFRDALRAVLLPQDDDAPPFVFLIHGEGGMGKSKLTRRFRDIATQEAPFESGFHVLLVDWELKRGRNLALQVGREAIRTETVFDALHHACVDAGWDPRFRDYQKAVKQRQQAEQKVARELERESGESRYAALRDLGAAGLAKLVRIALPVVGDSGEKLTTTLLSAGIQVGAEQAASLRRSADDFVQARLDPKHYDIYRRPNETLARALATGLKQVSRSKPLVLLLDTYEIIERTDPWLRVAIKNAGPRVLWVISGRHNLAPSRPTDRFVGYSAEFPRRLSTWDIQELAIEYVLQYLRDRVPDRETTRQDAEAIHRATSGVPLAMQAAADLWARGVPLKAITEGIPDRAPRDEIVRLMTERVLIHCDDPADRRAIYFLAMQRRPDPETLRSALRPAEGEPFDLTARLDQLARRYSSVRLTGGARLHEKTGAFIREYLLTTEARVTDDVRDLARHAAEAVRARRDTLEKGRPLLEECCESDDWTEATLDLAHWLLWQDELAAWDEIVPRFIEGLGYERDLCRGLLEVLEDFEPALGRDGQKQLKLLRTGLRGDFEDQEGMLGKLTRQAERAQPADDPRHRERRAILYLSRGKLLHRREQYNDALAALKSSRQLLPKEGESLKRQLAEAFNAVGWRLGLRRSTAIPSLEAELAFEEAVALDETEGHHWVGLGVMKYGLKKNVESVYALEKGIKLEGGKGYSLNSLGNVFYALGRREEAIESYRRAIELDPDDAYPHNGLGNVYYALGRREEAIASYRRAIELDPDFAYPHNGLGAVYRALGRREEAIAAFRRAIELDPDDAAPHNNLGAVYADLGRHEEAIAAYRRAIELDPDDAYPHNGLGNVYRALGRYEEAIEAYRRAIELDPDLAHPHNGLGNVYRDLGRREEAIESYQRAIELDPDYAGPHTMLGALYELDGQLEDARREHQRAVELQPDDGTAHASLASVLRRLGRAEEAAEHLAQARQLLPPDDHYNLACLESVAGNVEAALEHLAQALEQAPGDRAWAARDTDLAWISDDPRFQALIGGENERG